MNSPDFYDYDIATGELTPVFVFPDSQGAAEAPAGALAGAAEEVWMVFAEVFKPIYDNVIALCQGMHEQFAALVADAIAAIVPGLTAPVYAAVHVAVPSSDFEDLVPDATPQARQAAPATTAWWLRFLSNQAWTGIGAIAGIIAAILAAATIMQTARSADDQPAEPPIRYEAPDHQAPEGRPLEKPAP